MLDIAPSALVLAALKVFPLPLYKQVIFKFRVGLDLCNTQPVENSGHFVDRRSR